MRNIHEREAHEERHRARLEAFDEYFAQPKSPLRLQGPGAGRLEGWFLGPKAENEELLLRLIGKAVREHAEFRRSFHPEDPEIIDRAVKRSAGYKEAVSNLETHAEALFEELKMSAPIASLRHQGHMLWDQALPAVIGYFGAMLYDQNNVAAEASPVTTHLEIEVGNDLCRMLGYHVPPPDPLKKRKPTRGMWSIPRSLWPSMRNGSSMRDMPGMPGMPNLPVPWGHLTCDGSVANIEALWAARNIKLFAIGLRAALRGSPVLARARRLTVKLLDDTFAYVADLDSWTLLNLRIDDVAGLPLAIERQFGISTADTTQALADYSVAGLGLVEFYRELMSDVPRSPVVLVPSTRHYSWPKAATLLGLGKNNLRSVPVDVRARMRVDALRAELETCLQERVPVIAVVAVIGSTEESAVDPLSDVLSVREEFRKRGLDFAVHADAAWGGYFSSMLRSDRDEGGFDAVRDVPEYPMSAYVRDQYRALRDADSITVDPHKAGYAPYPAGGLCYRNSALRDQISLKAPVIFHSQSEPTVGIYGIEGSKPGAAAAAVYLAHRVIPPDKSGYGRILGECMWTSKRMYARLVTMEDERFKIVFFQELPSERAGAPPEAVAGEKRYIREHFVDVSNDELRALLRSNAKARDLFAELGSDQVILAYSFNFYERPGQLNQDPDKVNALMDCVFDLCSVTKPLKSTADLNKVQLIVTSSSFDPALYGADFVDRYAQRLGLPPGAGVPIDFLISTTMNPWTTDTPKGDFLKVIEKSLRGAVHHALDDMKKKKDRMKP